VVTVTSVGAQVIGVTLTPPKETLTGQRKFSPRMLTGVGVPPSIVPWFGEIAVIRGLSLHVVVSHGRMTMAAARVSLQPLVELVTLTLIGVSIFTLPGTVPFMHAVV
jgi:hypothetical protein